MSSLLKIGILILIFIFFLSACGKNELLESSTQAHRAEDGKTLIRLSTTTPDEHSTSMGAYKFKEILEDKSNGQIEVQVFTNLQLGSLREQTEATQLGTIEMSLSLVSTVSSFVDDLKVLEYPYLWPEEEKKLWEIVDGGIGKQVSQLVHESGFEGLGLWAGGYKVVTNKGNPILSLDDFKGLKVRVIPSEVLLETYKTWGADPIPVDFAEVYNALQMGTVDAQENPLETTFTQKYYEVQDELTVLNHGYQFHFMLANKQWFDNLTPEIQQMIKEADEQARKYAREINMESEEERLVELENSGLEVHELSAENKQAFIDLSKPIHQKLSDTKQKRELLQAIYKELDNKEFSH